MLKIAINGFGRIGKTLLRVIQNDLDAVELLDVKLINVGKGDSKLASYAFEYDSTMGRYQGEVEQRNSQLIIDEKPSEIIQVSDPLQAPWGDYDIDWVVDCSGVFTDLEGASKHLEAGASRVLISAPATDGILTIVPGVNDELYDPEKHMLVSLGSCTTNALAPVVKILNDAYQIEQAFVTTVHAYTNRQKLLDSDPSAKNPRRSRAAGLNIVPTTTGATKLIDLIIPEVSGKITGIALRVPVADVSLLDVTAQVRDMVSAQDLNTLFVEASHGRYKNIVEVSNEPLVSSDYIGSMYSVVIDSLLTSVQGNCVKLYGWYDNEWGYCERMKDFLLSVSP